MQLKAGDGSVKKWATVQAPNVPNRTSLIGINRKGEKPSEVAIPDADGDESEPKGPIEHKLLLAGEPGNWPKGIKAGEREKYLSDEQFQKLFSMSKVCGPTCSRWVAAKEALRDDGERQEAAGSGIV